MPEQHYKNHSRMVPLFHYVTFGLILAVIVASGIKVYRSFYNDVFHFWIPAVLLVVGVVLGLLAWFTRSFAIKAQDRAIRAEENLRYYAITGSLYDNRLTIQQVIALRFAHNNELVELAHRAVNEQMKPSDIKKAIKSWKEDHHRV